MAYDKTKHFIIEQSKLETLYQIDYLKKKKAKGFTEQEIFCLNLCFLTKKLSERPFLFNTAPIIQDMGIQRTPDGWFCVEKDYGKGRFINANALFKNVLCEEKACHDCAFAFASSYQGRVSLKSGVINPYHLTSGILHSICEFERNFSTYVFDGANYLVMDRDLYYSLFNFTEIQTIGQQDLWEDIHLFSRTHGTPEFLKNNRPYLPPRNWKNVEKHFEGMGFLLYLYDRDASVNSDLSLAKQVERNKKDMVQLEETVAVAKAELEEVKEDIFV